jgi:hypothetical protein
MKTNLLIVAVLFLFGACKPKSTEIPEEKATNVVNFSDVKVFKHQGNCENEKEPCVLADLKFLQVKDSTFTCFEELNTTLQLAALDCAGLLPDSTTNQAIDMIASVETNFELFEDFEKDFPENTQNWEARSNMKLVFQNDSLFSIQTDGYNSSGGAHPNSFNQILLFDKVGCKQLSVDEIFVQNNELLNVVEKYFRKERNIPQEQSLNEFGFYFENEQFILPSNIGIENDNIAFLYNDYEVGPHAMGSTFFKIPKNELKSFLKLKF